MGANQKARRYSLIVHWALIENSALICEHWISAHLRGIIRNLTKVIGCAVGILVLQIKNKPWFKVVVVQPTL